MRVTLTLLITVIALTTAIRYASPASKIKLTEQHKKSAMLEVHRPESFSKESDMHLTKMTHAHTSKGSSVDRYAWGKATSNRAFKWNPYSLIQKGMHPETFSHSSDVLAIHRAKTTVKTRDDSAQVKTNEKSFKWQPNSLLQKQTPRLKFIQKKMRQQSTEPAKLQNFLEMSRALDSEKSSHVANFLQHRSSFQMQTQRGVFGWLWSKLTGHETNAGQMTNSQVEKRIHEDSNKNSHGVVQQIKTVHREKAPVKKAVIKGGAKALPAHKKKAQAVLSKKMEEESVSYKEPKAAKSQVRSLKDKNANPGHKVEKEQNQQVKVHEKMQSTAQEKAPGQKQVQNKVEKDSKSQSTPKLQKKGQSTAQKSKHESEKKVSSESSSKENMPPIQRGDFVPSEQPVPNPERPSQCESASCPTSSNEDSDSEEPCDDDLPLDIPAKVQIPVNEDEMAGSLEGDEVSPDQEVKEQLSIEQLMKPPTLLAADSDAQDTDAIQEMPLPQFIQKKALKQGKAWTKKTAWNLLYHFGN